MYDGWGAWRLQPGPVPAVGGRPRAVSYIPMGLPAVGLGSRLQTAPLPTPTQARAAATLPERCVHSGLSKSWGPLCVRSPRPLLLAQPTDVTGEPQVPSRSVRRGCGLQSVEGSGQRQSCLPTASRARPGLALRPSPSLGLGGHMGFAGEAGVRNLAPAEGGQRIPCFPEGRAALPPPSRCHGNQLCAADWS